MMSRWRAILSLSMVMLMLVVPWTVAADSSGRDGDEASDDIRISISKNTVSHTVEVEVEFENLTLYSQYDYEIWFTRVDPIFPHETLNGSFFAEGDNHEVTREWTPDQDGPYTVHITLIENGGAIKTNTDTFDWGDYANNSHQPVTEISVDYDGNLETGVGIGKVDGWYYLDVFENDSLQDNITIDFEARETETGADYQMQFTLYRLDAEENERLIGMGVSSLHAGYTMATLNNSIGGWNDGEDYQFTLTLNLDWDNMTQVAFTKLNFTVGTPPVLNIPGCTNANATNYLPNATLDDGTCTYDDTDGDGIFDHLEIDGCTDEFAENHNQTATEDDGSCEYKDTDGDGVFDHLEIGGCTDKDAANFNSSATDDDESCLYDSDKDGVYDHLEIDGCTDKNATNHEPDATEDNGACTYSAPLDVIMTTNRTAGDAPLDVAFFAEISGGKLPMVILWNFGDGTNSDLIRVNHTFSAGVYNIVLQVTDNGDEMQERNVQIVATDPPVITNLTGYFTHSGQLEPLSKGMVATFEFTGTASGGEGPYTFTWKFGDDTEEAGSPILHEYARLGEYNIQLTIEDSIGRTLQLEESITISKMTDGDTGGITPTQDDLDGDGSNFDIYATSTGAIGLLLIFGLFGRKRRESFLDAERRKMHGEGSLWDDY
ncbi:MAG: PKD domain-containing protein [Candidatus Poseidoniales archaeon]|nr:PKD domain-containing protein [Candidatus Poseidoniales archaeon]